MHVLQQGEAIAIGQAKIEDDSVVSIGGDGCVRVAVEPDGIDDKARARQCRAQDLCNAGFVLDDQEPHVATSPRNQAPSSSIHTSQKVYDSFKLPSARRSVASAGITASSRGEPHMSNIQPANHSRTGLRTDPVRLDADFKSAGAMEPWPDVDPSLVEDDSRSGPEFPLDLLALPWRAWVSDTGRAAGVPADYVVQSLLAAVAGVCGAGVSVQVTPTWREPLVLGLALVGRRASGKSPALAAVRASLERLEAELKASDPERAPHLLVAGKDAAALAQALGARPQGVLLWRDEASAWFTDLPDAGMPVSVVGSMHPDHLMEALAKGKDSFAARFLYVWPDPPPYCRLVDRRQPDNERTFALLRRLMRIAGTAEKPLVLAFDETALKAFDGFLEGLHAALRTVEGLEADWMGKGSGTVARLAGVLALLAWVGSDAGGTPSRVDTASVETAARLWNDYFHAHANLVFDRAGPSDLLRQARRVVRWLQANRASQFTREDVRSHALCRSVNAGRTDMVLGRLWAGGVVQPVRHVSSPQGGRPPQLWQVNPALVPAK
jgi:hypothetical protein